MSRPADPGAGAPEGPPSSLEDGCVLVVDDEPDIRDTLCELVEMVGCSPIMAANGAEALALLRARRPCLMILDILMPVMTGIELLEAIEKEPALAVPVVVSTSAPGRAPPGFPVVKKPIDVSVMIEWMRRSCRCATVASYRLSSCVPAGGGVVARRSSIGVRSGDRGAGA